MNELYVLFFTACGEEQARRVRRLLPEYSVTLCTPGTPAAAFVQQAFDVRADLVFVGAMGIAVRLIAPYLKRKDVDPAVVVMDDLGKYAISVLSGHIGGANNLCRLLAERLECTPVITTATDLHHQFAVDSWAYQHQCTIADLSKIKTISAALLKGESIGFQSVFPVEGTLPFRHSATASAGIYVGLDEERKPFEETLSVIPRVVTLGVGCRKETDVAAFEQFVLQTLLAQKISLRAVKQLVSIDLKAEEACLLCFSEKYQIPFLTASAEELNAVVGSFAHSELVQRVTGTDNVCERSAVYFSKGRIVQPKLAKDGMTLAFAVEDWKCMF